MVCDREMPNGAAWGDMNNDKALLDIRLVA
jgi:hypothetical protein